MSSRFVPTREQLRFTAALGGVVLVFVACSAPPTAPAPAPAPTTVATTPAAPGPVLTASPPTTPPPLTDPPTLPGDPSAYPSATPSYPPPVPSTYPPGYPATPGACTIQTGLAGCDQCMMQACCTQIMACEQNADCIADDQCSAQCDQLYGQNYQYVEQCYTQCDQKHPVGAQILESLWTCADTTCAAYCQF